MKALRLDHKFIAYHKPEDDPYIESFHGKFKRGVCVALRFSQFPGRGEGHRGSVHRLQKTGQAALLARV